MNTEQQTGGTWGIVYCEKNALGSRYKWELIERLLKEKGVSFEVAFSSGVTKVADMVKAFIDKGFGTVVVVGGDAALNEAVNSLMHVSAEVRKKLRLGVIPNGLMNDFSHFWGIENGDISAAVDWLVQGRVRKIDVGNIRYTNTNGEACHRYFINCVNIGLVASMMNVRYWARHAFFGSRTLSMIVSFIVMLFHRLDYRMRLKINTETVHRKVMTLCIGNCTGYGQTPNAVPYNGLLDVSVVYPTATMQFFEGVYLFLRGKFLNSRKVKAFRAREITVEDVGRAMIGVDGRLMNTPKGSFTVGVEQEVVNFIIPT